MKEYPWLKKYPKVVSPEINTQPFTSLVDLLEQSFKKFPNQEAFENMNKSITFKEVDLMSQQFAAYLQHEAGLKKGDCIAIQMPNCLQYPVVLFGALRAGLTVVNTNPLYTPREMEHQFKDANVKAVIILANFAYNLEKIIKNTQIKTVIVTQLGDLLGGLKKPLVNFVVKYIKKMVPSYSLPQAISFSKAMKLGANHSYQKPNITPEDLAFLQYTGGTTGVSKGAMLTHANMVAHTAIINEWFKPLFKDGRKELIVTAIPLYHIFALGVNCFLMIYVGAKNLLITNPRDMSGFLKELQKYPFTIITGVNTLFNGMLHHPEFKNIDFSHLKITIGGGMAVQRAVAEAWEKETKTPLLEGYGLSETSPVLTCNPLDGTNQIGTIGLPLPNTEVAIFDEEGNQLKKGERGEICARGPQVMKGYWKKEDLNNQVFYPGGWFKTGDIGIMQEDGFFKIVDRKKDMINVSGFNVYPNEVEDVIAAHPKVLEVAAIGVPDEKSTEVVKIFVVKKDQSLTEEELDAYCDENLTGYKRPKYIEFRDELPKSNVGKIIRRALREEK